MKRLTSIGAALGLMITLAGGCGRAPGEDLDKPRPAHEGAAAVSATVYRVPIDGAPAAGDSRAPVTLVAFSDYECPFCARGHAVVEQLRKAYGPKLRVVARQNPLSFHARAEP